MAFPEVTLSVDYTSKPLEIPNDWTAEEPIRSFSFHQGRQRLLDRTEVGSAQVTLDIRAGMPTAAAPGNHVKLEAVHAGSTYPLFRGFVRAWPREWPGEVDQVSRIEAEDAFTLMARYELEGQAVAELPTGEHLEAVLTAFGWPPLGTIPAGSDWWLLGQVGASELGTTTFLGENLSSLETGHATIMALNLEGNLLEHLLNAAETTEGGTFYIGPSGDVVFAERARAHDPILGTWGPDPGDLPYVFLVMRRDDQEIYNDIRLTNRGSATEHQASDATSITDHGPRTLSITDLLFSTETAVENRASELLGKHKTWQEYPAQMVMRPKPDSGLWPLILGATLGSKIQVKHRYGAETLTFDSLVVGVTFEVGEFWEVIWDLAPFTVVDAWYLGIPGASELGTTTVLA